jgi:hypothetical protein
MAKVLTDEINIGRKIKLCLQMLMGRRFNTLGKK